MRLLYFIQFHLIYLFLEYVAEALGTRTHADACGNDLENYGMCMLVIVKMGNKQHPPPFWFTIKRKAVFVWVSRYEGTPPALAVASFVQVNYIGLRTGGPRHQTSCIDELGPLQASYFVY